jgi:hypothetical protein
MIGAHKVEAIPDPSASFWTSIASNSHMVGSMAGWAPGPFSPADDWVWNPANYAQWVKGLPSLYRDQHSPIPRVVGADTYRVTVRGFSTIDKPPMWAVIGLHYGLTAADAWAGPFWNPNSIAQAFWFPLPPALGGAGVEWTFTYTADAREIPPAYAFLGPNVQLVGPNNQTALGLAIDSIDLTVETADAVDISCLVDSVSIQHGRQDATGQPDASAVTIDLGYDSTTGLGLPDGFDVGSVVQVTTTLDDVASVRFSGRVTDVLTGWDAAGGETPNTVVAQVMAAGPLADAGRRLVGDEPWPQELDGARVARVLSLAGFAVDSVTSDPGTVQVIPQDVDKQAALGLVQQTAFSASGIVWETRQGTIRYADAEHRRGTAPGLVLDACDVLVTPTWRRDTSGLVNALSVGYGVPPVDEDGGAGGEQPRYYAERADSRARYGEYAQSVTTDLATLADAQAMTNLVLTRNRVPVWILSELPVDVANLDPGDTANLLALDMHDLLEISGLPTTGATPANTSLWVEGWTETLSFGVHEMALFVSGYCRTSPPPRWDDVPDVWTWDTLPRPDITWDDASCFGPPLVLGRWSDVPASMRWDFVAPAITWDTWPY